MASGSGQFSGQRAKKPHLVRGTGGLQGEVGDLRDDIKRDFESNAAMAVEEFTDPPAADPDGIKAAIATVASIQSYSGAALDGALAGSTFDPPRNPTVTTAGTTPADAPATATFTGTDVDDNAITETVTVAQTATIAAGAKAFKTITKIDLPAADGTDATLAFGIGNAFGLSKPIASRAGAAAGLSAIEAGSASSPAAGTFATAAAAAPKGTYTPSAAADGSNDYAVYYEYDASQNT